MTKKHFIALADHIKNERAYDDGMTLWGEYHVNSLATFLESQNPRFNRSRWLGYINGTCGKNGGKVK